MQQRDDRLMPQHGLLALRLGSAEMPHTASYVHGLAYPEPTERTEGGDLALQAEHIAHTMFLAMLLV